MPESESKPHVRRWRVVFHVHRYSHCEFIDALEATAAIADVQKRYPTAVVKTVAIDKVHP